MDKPLIIADVREQAICRALGRENAVIERSQLQVGDFILSDRVGVERKQIKDFLQSIVDQRIFHQAERLAKTFERPLLILEGNPELLFLERNIHRNTIRGVLASIAIDYSIPIIWTQNAQETACQLQWIANREQLLEKRGIQIRQWKKTSTLRDMQEFLLAGLPGVSSARAKRLLKHFKTPEKVFSATEQQLREVDGVGEKTSRKMKEVLRQECDGRDSYASMA